MSRAFLSQSDTIEMCNLEFKFVFQVPQARNVNYHDRSMLQSCFSTALHKRVRVNPEEPDYARRLENRHVLDRKKELLLFVQSVWIRVKHLECN